MYLNSPSQSLQENSVEPSPPPPPPISGDAEDKTLNDIKDVCYELRRGSHQ
ncbi:hypothetical protein QIA25_05165 (plasmid) [Borreliella spielmanii]